MVWQKFSVPIAEKDAWLTKDLVGGLDVIEADKLGVPMEGLVRGMGRPEGCGEELEAAAPFVNERARPLLALRDMVGPRAADKKSGGGSMRGRQS